MEQMSWQDGVDVPLQSADRTVALPCHQRSAMRRLDLELDVAAVAGAANQCGDIVGAQHLLASSFG